MNEIAIMQGRLLPPYEGRFQAFPAKQWRDEFASANKAGLGCIEWIFEKPNEHLNPFGSDEGIKDHKNKRCWNSLHLRRLLYGRMSHRF